MKGLSSSTACTTNQFKVAQLVDIILVLNILAVYRRNAGYRALYWCNPFALNGSKHRGIDRGGSRLESAVGIGDGIPCIVVEMGFDIRAHFLAKDFDVLVDFKWSGRPHRVGDTDAIDSQLINSRIDLENVMEFGTE